MGKDGERLFDALRSRRLRYLAHAALRAHSALMQHDDSIAVRHLVDEVRGPEDADAFRGDESANMPDDIGPRFDIEAYCRFVEKKQPRLVQQRARDLKPPHLPAGKVARLIAGAAVELYGGERLAYARAGVVAGNAVQRGVIEKVLRQGKI